MRSFSVRKSVGSLIMLSARVNNADTTLSFALTSMILLGYIDQLPPVGDKVLQET